MEHKAIRTLLKRMGSVLLVYGDEPGGALATLDEGNILMELTRQALMGTEGQIPQDDSDLASTYSAAATGNSMWLSLPAPSSPAQVVAVQVTLSEQAQLIWKAALAPPRKKVSASQLSFLDLAAD